MFSYRVRGLVNNQAEDELKWSWGINSGGQRLVVRASSLPFNTNKLPTPSMSAR